MKETESYKQIVGSKEYERTKEFMQHGQTSVYEHSISVCEVCFKIADKLHLKVNREALAKSALLHDYFLYDWHDKDHPMLHGIRHPYIAANNANRDFGITRKEARTIKCHMFPCGVRPPLSKESLILCIADKYCAAKESTHRRKRASR